MRNGGREENLSCFLIEDRLKIFAGGETPARLEVVL